MNPKKGHYLYIHYDSSDRPIYVGTAINPVQRTQIHYSVSRWIEEISTIKIMKFSCKEDARKAELDMIRQLKPKYNIRGKIKECKNVVVNEKQNENNTLTIEEFGRRIHIHLSKLKSYAKKGMPAIVSNNRVLIPVEQALNWIKTNRRVKVA